MNKSFFKKEQKKALLFEKRSKNFLEIGCVPGSGDPAGA
jgi:hypothetical protein